MEKFKDLNVPETDKKHFFMMKVQGAYCTDSFLYCKNTECKNCLFHEDNIDKFKEWYNLKLK